MNENEIILKVLNSLSKDNTLLSYLNVVGIWIAAIGAVYFGYRQYQINKRMQELADYVAVSISPQENFTLQLSNVGRSNLYLHKWEIGSLNETYVKPWLLPAEIKSKILIGLHPPQVGQHLAKFYLTDEGNQKFVATGEVAIEPIAFQLPISTTPPQQQEAGTQISGFQPLNVQLRMRAWAYKTEKYEWTI